MTYRFPSDLSIRNINKEIFVLKRTTTTIHTFNATGTCIWQLLQQNTPYANLSGRLTERFDVTRNNAENDIAEFVDSLVKQQLIEITE